MYGKYFGHPSHLIYWVEVFRVSVPFKTDLGVESPLKTNYQIISQRILIDSHSIASMY